MAHREPKSSTAADPVARRTRAAVSSAPSASGSSGNFASTQGAGNGGNGSSSVGAVVSSSSSAGRTMADWRKLESDLLSSNAALRRHVEELESKLSATASLAMTREAELESVITEQHNAIGQLQAHAATAQAAATDRAAALEGEVAVVSAARDAAVAELRRKTESLSARVQALLDDRHRFEARLESAGVDVVAAAQMQRLDGSIVAPPAAGSGNGWAASEGLAKGGIGSDAYSAHSDSLDSLLTSMRAARERIVSVRHRFESSAAALSATQDPALPPASPARLKVRSRLAAAAAAAVAAASEAADANATALGRSFDSDLNSSRIALAASSAAAAAAAAGAFLGTPGKSGHPFPPPVSAVKSRFGGNGSRGYDHASVAADTDPEFDHDAQAEAEGDVYAETDAVEGDAGYTAEGDAVDVQADAEAFEGAEGDANGAGNEYYDDDQSGQANGANGDEDYDNGDAQGPYAGEGDDAAAYDGQGDEYDQGEGDEVDDHHSYANQ